LDEGIRDRRRVMRKTMAEKTVIVVMVVGIVR